MSYLFFFFGQTISELSIIYKKKMQDIYVVFYYEKLLNLKMNMMGRMHKYICALNSSLLVIKMHVF